MTFLIQQTLLYAVPLMIVALAGVFAERSGIINLALEGIMIFGAFIGVLFVRSIQTMASICTMVPCSTLRELAAACRRLTQA
jgi:simple sugar transport system permease protein